VLTAAFVLRSTGIREGGLDVLFGGPPCQGFSEIGLRRHGDDRNRLLLEFARLVRELKPRYFVVENVRGLLFPHAKPTLEMFLRRVRRCGYKVVTPIRVLNAGNFGVPQLRRRAFLIGHLRDLPAPAYPEPITGEGTLDQCPTVGDAIGDLPNVGKFSQLLEHDVFTGQLGETREYCRRLRGETVDPADFSRPRQRATGISGCLRTVHTQQTVARFASTLPGTYEPSSRCYRLKWDAPALTLRAGTGPAFGSFTAARPIHPTQPRCITTREAARLHSFPDWFEFHPTKWHGFQQIGNSVPPLLARAVAKSVLAAISQCS